MPVKELETAPEAQQQQARHVYLVEDDTALREMVVAYLERQGLVVTAMADAEDLLRRMRRLRPDLVLLDIGLPGMSGLDACQKLRAQRERVPIVLLSARGDPVDRVLGLEMGADDYLVKPFAARELLARIRAVLRRSETSRQGQVANPVPLRLGEVVFIPAERRLHRHGELHPLNPIEYAVLLELSKYPNQVLSRERLLASAPGRDAVQPRAVDGVILRLRRLIESDPASPHYIRTVQRQGYMLVLGAAAA